MTDFESRVLAAGMNLYKLIEGETPSIFKKDFWAGKVMDWCMKDEAFKLEMFRFVDVFPSLKRSESVARHLQEYFCRPDQDFPSSLQWGLKMVSPGSMMAKVVAKTISANITGMARQFIVGEDAKEAISVLQKLRKDGMAFTVDLLGEAVVSENEAREYYGRYVDLIETLSDRQKSWKSVGADRDDLDWGTSPKVNISIKPSAMYSQMSARSFEHSVEEAKNRLRPLFRMAMEKKVFVLLDMEHTALKNLTLAMYKSLLEEEEFKSYPYTGIVIQAYLKESGQDLAQLIEWAKNKGQRITVRLVKGAYWDAETIAAKQQNWDCPVFTNKHETDANFEKLALMLLESHQWVSFACASHNIRTIAYVMEMAKELKVPDECLEFQVLYGMAEPVRMALKKAGLRLRLYAPIGKMLPGMAYLVRRLLENTANESFLRQSFSDGVAKESLLRNPLELLKESKVDDNSEPGAPEYCDRGVFKNEPVLDWTIGENRESFERALAAVKKEFGRKIPLYINGREVVTGKEIISTNPNRPTEVLALVSSAGVKEAGEAVAAAREAFCAWRDTEPGQRAQYLFKAASAAREMRLELAALQVFEVGKNWSEADADVTEAIDFLEYYGREMIRLSRPRRTGSAPGELSHLFYEPRGVGAVIAPWNFPLAISVGMTAAALVTGNTVVYKPASQSPVTGSMVYEIFKRAGLPAGVLNFLPGPGGEIGDCLVTHPEVSFITFTGSMEVGLRIIDLAAKTPAHAMGVKSVVAEMGGKNAIIVDSDADIDEAVTHTLYSAFGFQGQKCSACSRAIVLEENYGIFVERLAAAAGSINIGNTEDPRVFMGAVIDDSARKKIMSFIEQGKKEGRVLVHRELPVMEGHYVPLTIIEGVRPDSVIAQEEIFGPVLAVIKVKDFSEALQVANGTRYALTGGVFSRSPENLLRARREFRVGNLYINRGCTGAIVERHPFGGFKMSGVGSKSGGPDYLLQFTVPRVVTENTMRRGFAPAEEGDE
ncbi:MAG: 1-pyrroline-5-carboxylate dehydrogenase [Peptococcaceae bacterium BICA1-7]|nr:MAG: 1-pyrroline-5-carboxylate dehydrogenase [Peptococcaceae bacterium BICA1-7]HBV97688.1 L-glutamate gamma-semialdehyde dehydrogenase [Desulfotomaculum sp.]